MDVKTVGVLGCGLMGSGIAQVCAAAGYKTIVKEVDKAVLEQGLARIRKFLDDGVTKGKVTAESRDSTLGRLSGAVDSTRSPSCDIVVEAIVENLDAKRPPMPGLEKRRRASHTIFCSNTSSLCITGAGGGDEASGSLRRAALLQPGAADEARRR